MAQKADARLLCHLRVAVVKVAPQELSPHGLVTRGLHSRTNTVHIEGSFAYQRHVGKPCRSTPAWIL